MSAVVEATRENFDEVVSGPGMVLVDFWGPQCRPCIALEPHIASLPERYPTLMVAKLEAPKARRVCINHRVMGLPTLLLFHDGEELSRISDPQLTSEQVDAWLHEQLRQETKGDAADE